MSTGPLRKSELVDALGVLHARAEPSARIVSLVPSITELLLDLGLKERIVGRTRFCIHPAAEVASVTRVGGTKEVKLDKLRALVPTHVIVNIDENTKTTADEIATFAPNTIVTHPIGPRDNLYLYRLLGGIFGAEQRAEELCDEFERAYDALRASAEKLPSRRVLYLIWRSPWMTVSPSTYISRTLALVNWTTVGGNDETRYPEIDLKHMSLEETDIVLFSSEPYPFKPKHLDELRAHANCGAATLSLIDGEMTSWYGSRAIKGLEYLQSFAPSLLKT